MALADIRSRPQYLAPQEEFQQRLKYVSPPEKLSDADFVLLLNHTRYATVERCKITFAEGGVDHKFKHVDALSCQPSMNGNKVLIHWVRDFPDVIFVLTNDLKLVEVVPREGKVKWFDSAAAAKGIRDQQTQLNRISAELTELHKDETKRVGESTTRNLQKAEEASALQFVNTFPVSAQRDGITPTPIPEIEDAQDESEPVGGSRSREFPDGGRSLTPVGDLAEAEDQPDQRGGRTPLARRHTISRPSDAISEEINRQRARKCRDGETQRAAGRILKASVRGTDDGETTTSADAGTGGIMGILMRRSRTANKTQEVGE
jgi:hypothetical protein